MSERSDAATVQPSPALTSAGRRVRLRRARRWSGIAVAATGGLGLLTLGWPDSRAERCAGAEEHLQGIWDDERREHVRASLLATLLPYAKDVTPRIEGELDRYATAWTDTHREVCEAATMRGEQTKAVMVLRMACLQRARVELRAVTEVLANADARVLEHAHEALTRLPPLPRCDDVVALQSAVPPPDERDASAVDDVRTILAQAKALRTAGKPDEAFELANRASAEADRIAYGAITVEMLQELAALRMLRRDYPGAEADLERALRIATRSEDWQNALVAATSLAKVVGLQSRTQDGLAHAATARDLLRFGDASAEAALWSVLAQLHRAAGAQGQARAASARALALRETALGPGHPSVAEALRESGTLAWTSGRYGEAQAFFERSLAIEEITVGPEHPSYATGLELLASVTGEAGELEKAATLARKSVAIRERALGPADPRAATATHLLGVLTLRQGRDEAAYALFERAHTVLAKTVGIEHPACATAAISLASAHAGRGDHDAEIAETKAAVAILEKTLEPEHPDVAAGIEALADLLGRHGELDDAVALRRRVLQQREKTLGRAHPLVAAALGSLAELDIRQGKAAKALAMLERARAIDDATPGWQPSEASRRFAYAKLLLQAHGDRGRALAEAVEAVEGLRTTGEGGRRELAEVEAWIAGQGG